MDIMDGSLQDFQSYLDELDFCNNIKNPWFIAAWSEKLQSLGNNTESIMASCIINNNLKRYFSESFYSMHDSAAYVMDAALALAYALHSKLGCNSTHCSPVDNLASHYDRLKLNEYLSKVTFKGISNDDFHFRADGTNHLLYNIINLQVPAKSIGKGPIKHVKVGYWDEDYGLIINKTKIKWNSGIVPVARCSDDCQPGTYRYYNSLDKKSLKCCWLCTKCYFHSITNSTNQSNCTKCEPFTAPNENKTKCIGYEIINISFRDKYFIIACCLWFVFLINSIFIWVVVIIKRNTPVIKGSNFTLINILMGYNAMSLPASIMFLCDSTVFNCTFRLLLTANSQTGVAVTVICKTIQVAAIFRNGFRQRSLYKKLSKTRNQVIVFIVTMTITNAIIVGLIVYQSLKIIKYENDKQQLVKSCEVFSFPAFTAAVVLWTTAVTVGLVFAFRIRSLPDNCNDARYILIASILYAFLALTVTPVMYFFHGQLRSILSCLMMIFYEFVTQFCYFLPKMYIIIRQPHLNTQYEAAASIAKFTFAKVDKQTKYPNQMPSRNNGSTAISAI
ncbi:Metabotropic glutamate receptor 1 [Trichoplax sp. H2]|nr:Metabotropic glutamate receptor 1 [Trichoplax sp. H2]|eukprot:RDD39064.1 Metabotropic glutamate receptor 1 [Trichoplax sp. H2]